VTDHATPLRCNRCGMPLTLPERAQAIKDNKPLCAVCRERKRRQRVRLIKPLTADKYETKGG